MEDEAEVGEGDPELLPSGSIFKLTKKVSTETILKKKKEKKRLWFQSDAEFKDCHQIDE